MDLHLYPNYIKVLTGTGESKKKATTKATSKAKSKEPGRTWTSILVHDPALIHHECALTPGSILGGRSGCAPAAPSGRQITRAAGAQPCAPTAGAPAVMPKDARRAR